MKFEPAKYIRLDE